MTGYLDEHTDGNRARGALVAEGLPTAAAEQELARLAQAEGVPLAVAARLLLERRRRG